MKLTRIAFVRQRYAFHGGAEQVLARTMAVLRADGVQVSLITHAWEPTADLTMHRCTRFTSAGC